MVFWNSLDILEPPTQLCNVSTGVFRKADLMKIQNVVSSASITLNKLSQLHVEAVLVSRIIYKQKTRLRHDKGFKKLEKVNRGLLKYLAFDIASVYTKFRQLLPVDSQEFEFAVPSKQILEWVLVSTQGFAKLFCVIADTCEETACFWKANIQGGNMCNISLMIMGVVGRIWVYAKFLVQNACYWFSELRPYLTILQLKGVAWLPKDYEIPQDLKIWLKSPHITNPTSGVKSQQDKTNNKHIFDLIGLEEILDGEKPNIATSNNDLPLSNCVDVEGRGDAQSQKKIKSEPNLSLAIHGKSLILSTEMKDLGVAVPRNVVKAKDPINFGKQVPQIDTRHTEIKKSKKKKKKRRHDSSLREDIDESQFSSNLDCSKIVEHGLDFTTSSDRLVSKKKKKKERSLLKLQTKNTIMSFAQSLNFGEQVPQIDTTEINTLRKKKKRRHDGSVREDIESQFSSNLDCSKIVENGLDFNSERLVSKKEKRKKKKQRSILQSQELVKSNVSEMASNTKLPITTNNGNEGTSKVQMLSLGLDRLTSEYHFSANESESKVTTSKRKRKKKPKFDHHLSLVNALMGNKQSNPNKTVKHTNTHLLKQSKTKKRKWENQ